MPERKLDILVIIGTVREERKSIRPAKYVVEKLEERGHEADLFDMAEKDIPLLKYTRYSDNDKHPEDVEEFGQKVENADGLLIVTPEYNHSIPGALKNLLDYLYPEYDDKPFSFVTVSAGNFGGVRSLSDLRDLVSTLGGHPGPDIPVSNVESIFNEEGEPEDDDYIDRFESFLDEVEEHADRFS
ncbi:MAG: NADPH-dependent FMN reductase [Candidatus Nanohaloarchaea archaeon]